MKIARPDERNIPLDYRVLNPEELAAAYVLARAAFTAEDLQRYTELDPLIPADEVLAELEARQKQFPPSTP
jgi:hypothetical protein